MNLLLLFIFMNSCHLAQCEMMGHFCATRRAGAELTIIHINPPSSPHLPVPILLRLSSWHLPESAEYGSKWREGRNRATQRGRDDILTGFASVTRFLPKGMWQKNEWHSAEWWNGYWRCTPHWISAKHVGIRWATGFYHLVFSISEHADEQLNKTFFNECLKWTYQDSTSALFKTVA